MAKLKSIRSKVTLNGELMFPNDYVSAPELQSRDVVLTIAAVSKEMLQKTDGKSKGEMVLRFKGTTKKFVCNKTNATLIAGIYGTRAEEWIGKRITLYPTRCLAFGETVDCIRVRDTAPAAPQAPAAAQPAAETKPEPAADASPFPAEEPSGLPADDGQDLVGGSAFSGGPNRAKVECTPGANGCDDTFSTVNGRKVCALHK